MAETLAPHSDDFKRTLQTIALRKIGIPSDIAAAIIFLASPILSGHITGQTLTVSGGMEGRVLYEKNEVFPLPN